MEVKNPDNFTVHLFDPRPDQPEVAASINEHSAGLKASLMIRGPLTLTLTRLLWKNSPEMIWCRINESHCIFLFCLPEDDLVIFLNV